MRTVSGEWYGPGFLFFYRYTPSVCTKKIVCACNVGDGNVTVHDIGLAEFAMNPEPSFLDYARL